MGMATIFLWKFWDDTNIPNSLGKEHHFLTLTNLVESLNEPEPGGKGGGKVVSAEGKAGAGNAEGSKPWESAGVNPQQRRVANSTFSFPPSLPPRKKPGFMPAGSKSGAGKGNLLTSS